jgi:hypothetical protein
MLGMVGTAWGKPPRLVSRQPFHVAARSLEAMAKLGEEWHADVCG